MIIQFAEYHLLLLPKDRLEGWLWVLALLGLCNHPGPLILTGPCSILDKMRITQAISDPRTVHSDSPKICSDCALQLLLAFLVDGTEESLCLALFVRHFCLKRQFRKGNFPSGVPGNNSCGLHYYFSSFPEGIFLLHDDQMV